MDTRITELFGITYPIIQGGMAWVAEYHLAAAVSEAGGLGVISAAGLFSDALRRQIRKVRELTTQPVGVHIPMSHRCVEEIAELVMEEGVRILLTDSGSPTNFIKRWKSAGMIVVPAVSSVTLAKMMEQLGADAVVAVGTEASGHAGITATMALVPQLADVLSVPLIAAGGIADGRGFAAALILGAEGVLMRTRFCVALEAVAHENYKNKIIRAKDIDSVMTGVNHGFPLRQLGGRMTDRYWMMEERRVPLYKMEMAATDSLKKAVIKGDMKKGTVIAGQTAGIIKKIQPCREILQEMTEEARRLLNR